MTRSSIRRRDVSCAARARRFVVSLCLCMAVVALCAARTVPIRAQTAKPTAPATGAKSGSCLAPIKSFVNADTLVVARVNLEQVDSEQLARSLEGVFTQALALFEFSPESQAACSAEFHKTIAALQQDVQTAQSEFRAQYGVSEAFFVQQTLHGDGACLIVPLQGATDAQVEALKEYVKDRFKLTAAVYQKKYLLASKTPLKELGAFYQSFKPGANKDVEEFFQRHRDKLFAAYAARVKIRPLLHSSSPTDEDAKAARIRQYDPFANSPQAVKTLVEVFDSSFVGGSAYVDASNLSANCTLTFNTASSAGQFRDALSDSVETFNSFYFKLLESAEPGARSSQFAPGASLMRRSKETAARYYMYQWTRDVWTGRMRRYLPSQERESLVFDLSLQNEIQKLGVNTIAVWLYTKNTDLFSSVMLGSARAGDSAPSVDAQNPFALTTKSRKRGGELSANPFESNVVEESANPFDENVVNDGATSDSGQDDGEIIFDENEAPADGGNPFDAGLTEDESDAEGAANPFEAGVQEEAPSASEDGADSGNPFEAGVQEAGETPDK